MTARDSDIDNTDTQTEWTVEDLQQLRDDDEPGSEVAIVPAWTQSAWDRHHVAQLQAAEAAAEHLAADPGKTDSVRVRDALLVVGSHRAAHEHMEATRHEDERSFFAALCREYDARVIEPAAVHPPVKRQAPRRRSSKPRGGTS